MRKFEIWGLHCPLNPEVPLFFRLSLGSAAVSSGAPGSHARHSLLPCLPDLLPLSDCMCFTALESDLASPSRSNCDCLFRANFVFLSGDPQWHPLTGLIHLE